MSTPQPPPPKSGAPGNLGPQNYYATEPAAGSSSYTRPPPAYQADQSPLLGSPRSSEDNVNISHEIWGYSLLICFLGQVPDDFKYSTSVGEGSIDIRHAFIRKVYSILSAQLVLTAVVSGVSFFNTSFKSWIQNNTWMMIVSMVGSLGFLLATYWKRKSYPSNLLLLSAFTAFEAYTVAVITSFYDSQIVLQATVITGALFVALTLFACQTKYDFTSWYSYLYATLWMVVIFGFVAMFFPHNGMVELVYAGVCALLFSAYILVDTQLIMRRMHVEEEIAAAIALYLDIINLFISYVSPAMWVVEGGC